MELKFKKDLLVSIPTLDSPLQIDIKHKLKGPERLDRTLKMLYDQCKSKNNFNVQVIINDHQIEIYKKITDKWNIRPTIIKFDQSWKNLIKAQNDEMKKGDYYFFVFFPDDMYGLSKNWDTQIISKKKYFKDDLFVLFSKYDNWGRKPSKLDDCYLSPSDAFDSFEQNPVWTYKFGEFIYELFEEYDHDKGREMLIAIILHLLNKKGYNRHVESDLNYIELVCLQNKGGKDFPKIKKLIKNKCEELNIIVENMVKYIKWQEN
ncbi:MAG: hypothetical protein IIA87_03510 [Nanoarchaeota archaeon]|nr:hypothetical protein [Nanoarchaeota archaeon]